MLQPTDHSIHRQSRRNLSDADVQFVFQHGRCVRRAGVMHIFLGRRDIPGDKETQRQFGHLEGTTLVLDRMADTLILITAYRNRRGFKHIRTKAKYERYAS
ncbi:MAG: DUF4258 domain-containing protein [Chloroflexaceae bacterium]|nr:DUF4258 domain-containing protein [Chloroflexaceae bacterium]